MRALPFIALVIAPDSDIAIRPVWTSSTEEARMLAELERPGLGADLLDALDRMRGTLAERRDEMAPADVWRSRAA